MQFDGGSASKAPEVVEHLVTARNIHQTFKISVQMPVGPILKSDQFPVLYATDSDDYFGGIANIAKILQLLGETRRFILVGIGYGDVGAARMLRWRDFVTHDVRTHYGEMLKKLERSPIVGGACDLKVVTQTTDATAFLEFIREELVPYVNLHYPAMPNENSYYGYSAGAAFGLFTLFEGTTVFKRYILGSPGVSYNGHNFILEQAQLFVRSGRAMKASVFLSVGELEEFEEGFGSLNLVSGYYLLTKFMKSSIVTGLDLTARVFPNETHATSWPLALSHGLKCLLPPTSDGPAWRTLVE